MQKIIIDKWEAIVQFDADENKHVITFNGVGGAIVSDESITEAERKFVEAMKLAEDVGDVLKSMQNKLKTVLKKYNMRPIDLGRIMFDKNPSQRINTLLNKNESIKLCHVYKIAEALRISPEQLVKELR